MKANIFTKTASVLVAIWYLIAVVGFDIHNCSDNGRVYIEPLIAGISCDDIHPDTPCGCGHCHEAGCHCHEDEDCCSDTIEYLQLSGDNTQISYVPDVAVISLFTNVPISKEQSYTDNRSIILMAETAPPGTMSPDILDYCVLRV